MMQPVRPRGYGFSALCVLITMLALSAGAAEAIERHVPGQYFSIQQAVDAANPGDEVVLAPRTYTGHGNRDVEIGLKKLTIRGSQPDDPAVAAATIIDCQGTAAQPHRAFRWFEAAATSVTTTIAGLTIRNGYGPTETLRDAEFNSFQGSAGGAVYSNAWGLTLRNCVFQNNHAGFGGALYNDHRPRLYNCTFVDNTSRFDGGAVFLQFADEIPIEDCVFDRNAAQEGAGGGVFVQSGVPMLERCRFTRNMANLGGALAQRHENLLGEFCQFIGNTARFGGGAVYADGVWVTLHHMVVQGNTVDIGDGGGILAVNDAALWLNTLLLADNRANGDGGALVALDSRVRLSAATVAGNTAIGAGGAIYARGGVPCELVTSIVWGNQAGGIAKQATFVGSVAVTVSQCDVQSGPAGLETLELAALHWNSGNLDADPRFTDADGPDDDPTDFADNDYHLATGSPCIDRGPSAAGLPNETDLDGHDRFIDDPQTPGPPPGQPALADLGAYEYGAGLIMLVDGGRSDITVAEGGSVTVRLKLSAAPPGDIHVLAERISGDADLHIEGNPAITFTTADWDAWHTLVFAAWVDSDSVNSRAVFRIRGGGVQDLTLTLTEQETQPSIEVTPGAITVLEGGTASFTVHLSAAPVSAVPVMVSVAVAGANPPVQVIEGQTLAFRQADWFIDQRVTFRAARDADALDAEAGISCSAADHATAVVTVTVQDTWSDTGKPAVTILTPTAEAEYTTTLDTVTLGGTSTDDGNEQTLTWSNDRGGSGPCAGTSAWSAADIGLQPGLNVITVTARDALGQTGADVLTVLRTVPDTVPPTVTITVPTTADTLATASATILLAGSATDDRAVTQVAWSNNRGGAGACSGTTSWTASAIPLSPGENIITVTARDASGNTNSDTLIVTHTAADVTAPVVTITQPTDQIAFQTASGSLAIAGQAADAGGIAQVRWANHRGGSGICTGLTNWSAAGVALLLGENRITVTARDPAGNEGSDMLVVVRNWADEAPPSVVISTPNVKLLETSVAAVNLAGSAADDGEIVEITWSNDRGGVGTCKGTTTWSIAGIALHLGENVITISARDKSGRIGADQVTIRFVPPDAVPPTVAIVDPFGGLARQTGSAAFALRGSAADNQDLAQVTWQNDRGGSGVCTGAQSWTAEAIPLQIGRNIITVRAFDAAGNSASAAFDVIFNPQDTVAPGVVILEPPTGALETALAVFSLAGTASDDVGVVEVAWSNSRGGSGICLGTNSWSISGIALQVGDNAVQITARDGAGNSATATLLVTYTPAQNPDDGSGRPTPAAPDPQDPAGGQTAEPPDTRAPACAPGLGSAVPLALLALSLLRPAFPPAGRRKNRVNRSRPIALRRP